MYHPRLGTGRVELVTYRDEEVGQRRASPLQICFFRTVRTFNSVEVFRSDREDNKFDFFEVANAQAIAELLV